MAIIRGTGHADVLHDTDEADLIFARNGNDIIFAGDGDIIDGGRRTDRLILHSDTDNTVLVQNVEIITGGTKNDFVTETAALDDGQIDLGAGNDTFNFGNHAGSALFKNVETIFGGAFDQQVTLGADFTGSIELGAGSDRVDFGNFDATATLYNVETILGGPGNNNQFNGDEGDGNQDVTLGTAVHHAFVDLGAGIDALHIGNFTSDLTINKIEDVDAGSGSQVVKWLGGISGPHPGDAPHIDLGSDVDTLIFPGGGRVTHVENFIGTGNDDFFSQDVSAEYDANPHFNGRGGNDTLYFTTPTGQPSLTFTVDNIENVFTGATDDHIVVSSAPQGVHISGSVSDGSDTFAFLPGSAVATGEQTDFIANFQRGADKIDLSAYGLTLLPQDSPLDGTAPQATTHFDAAQNITQILINRGDGQGGAEEQINIAGVHLGSSDFIV